MVGRRPTGCLVPPAGGPDPRRRPKSSWWRYQPPAGGSRTSAPTGRRGRVRPRRRRRSRRCAPTTPRRGVELADVVEQRGGEPALLSGVLRAAQRASTSTATRMTPVVVRAAAPQRQLVGLEQPATHARRRSDGPPRREGANEPAPRCESPTRHRTMKSNSPLMNGRERRPNRLVDRARRRTARESRTDGSGTSPAASCVARRARERRAVERRDRQQVEQRRGTGSTTRRRTATWIRAAGPRSRTRCRCRRRSSQRARRRAATAIEHEVRHAGPASPTKSMSRRGSAAGSG